MPIARTAAANLTDPALVVVAATDSWNDYGLPFSLLSAQLAQRGPVRSARDSGPDQPSIG